MRKRGTILVDTLTLLGVVTAIAALPLEDTATFPFAVDQLGCLRQVDGRDVTYVDAGSCWIVSVALASFNESVTLSPSTCSPSRNRTTDDSKAADATAARTSSATVVHLLCGGGQWSVALSFAPRSTFLVVDFTVTLLNVSALPYEVLSVSPSNGMMLPNVSSTVTTLNPFDNVYASQSAMFLRFYDSGTTGLFTTMKTPFATYYADGCRDGVDRPGGDCPEMPMTMPVARKSTCAELCTAYGNACVAWVYGGNGSCWLKCGYSPALSHRAAACCSWARSDNVPPTGCTITVSPNMMSPVASWQADGWILGRTMLSPHLRSPVDFGELKAYREAVAVFLLDPHTEPVRLAVGWDSNDYQLDIATTRGQAEYRRLIDRASQFGLKNIIFAPSNSLQSSRANCTDAWCWEECLWLTMGEKVRQGTWDPARDALPAEIESLMQYAASRNVSLMAYVYPILGFQMPTGNAPWLFPCPMLNKNGLCATLANVEFQNYLANLMIALANRTGFGGFAFDYTFFVDPRSSTYAQVRGWLRVLTLLREAVPGIAIDQRQSAHAWGAWYQLPSSYTEPLAGDENPETYGVSFPSIHTDKVLANHLRTINYVYLMEQMLPVQSIPGFVFHQTERSWPNGTLALSDWNLRDYDYMSLTFSLLSTIATAPLNHVFAMIPARDAEEFELLPTSKIALVLQWQNFSATYRDVLVNALFVTAPPNMTDGPDVVASFGVVDGAVVGFLFLFNSGSEHQSFHGNLDDRVGLLANDSTAWMLTEIEPLSGRTIDVVQYGAALVLGCDAQSARVIRVDPFHADQQGGLPVALGAAATVSVSDGGVTLTITSVRGLAGRTTVVTIANLNVIPTAILAGAADLLPLPFDTECTAPLPLSQRVCVRVNVTLCGNATTAFQPISYEPVPVTNGWYNTTFVVPAFFVAQGSRRQQEYPINWTMQDLTASWLLPQRLLLYAVLDGAVVTQPPVAYIDGEIVEFLAAHTGRDNVLAASITFAGWYLDCSNLTVDVSHVIHFQLPPGTNFRGLHWENLETTYSESFCCVGFPRP